MTAVACAVLFAAAAFGLALYAVQLVSAYRHVRVPARRPVRTPGLSILKPLCGLDDELEQNLASFVALGYPCYEVLLGVRSRDDAAYPVALAAARRWPCVRVVLQRGEPGLNPKVNQLVTLAAAARYDILIVSDSNVRVDESYLWDIAAELEDARVGLVTHPVVGVGEARFGSVLDNLHLAGSVGAGMIGAKRVARQDIVVGKSMALRRHDLDALGGFAAVADVLAEDFVIGRLVPARLGKRVAVSHRPVLNVSQRRSVGDFYARYRRWSIMHRQAIGVWLYTAQLALNPLALALVALALSPSTRALGGVGAVAVLKIGYDALALRVLRGGRVPASVVLASPAKDLLLALAWVQGALRREVIWRGNRLRVSRGTRLTPMNGSPLPAALGPLPTAPAPAPSRA